VTSVDVDAYRRRLLEERRRVADAIDYLLHENAGSMEDEVAETPLDNHLAETATVTLDREIDYTLEENESRMLAAIDAALGRIDEGTFGTCSSCGNAIGEDRLDAIPYATLCIECKRKEERG
jgi:RNA polymerase-binding protein DksA